MFACLFFQLMTVTLVGALVQAAQTLIQQLWAARYQVLVCFVYTLNVTICAQFIWLYFVYFVIMLYIGLHVSCKYVVFIIAPHPDENNFTDKTSRVSNPSF